MLTVASFTDAWIETLSYVFFGKGQESHLLQMRGLKLNKKASMLLASVASFTDAWIETRNISSFGRYGWSHLLQMRGLKPTNRTKGFSRNNVASFTDAWIETL